jgi:hypothetical protein
VVALGALLACMACGYGTSATFNADGSVTVGLKFLFPKSLMQSGSGVAVSGLTPADITKANADLGSKYPGAKITTVTEGDESGALLTVPFKTEKDAFAFMTQPSKLSPAPSAGAPTIDLANTGGLFTSATHTTSGQSETYTFKTQPQAVASPSPGSQDLLTPDVLSSVFTITFALTVPHEITSAPDALFTQDRKTAIWKLSFTQAQTLTATTGPAVALTGFASSGGSGQNTVLLAGVALVAIVIGFFLGKITLRRPAPAPAPVAGELPSAFPPPPAEPPPSSA